MNNWQFVNRLESKEDNTIKYIWKSAQEEIAEISYINKHDEKDILCVPTQTSCKLGCKFCHLTDLDIPVRSFSSSEIFELIKQTMEWLETESRYLQTRNINTTLLISYMGSGEPLLNIDGVIGSAKCVSHHYIDYDWVRFAVASIIPSEKLFNTFKQSVIDSGLDFKFHLSLHSPFADIRKEIVPAGIPINTSVELVSGYAASTGQPVEAHYTIMENINDRDEDANALISLLKNKNIPLKFLRYSERKAVDLKRSSNVENFRQKIENAGIATEFYAPPGNDVGASCGQFLLDYYKPLKYQLNIISNCAN